MAKLTNLIRAEILTNVMAATTIPQEWEALEKEEIALADKLLVSFLPKDFNKLTATMPAAWFSKTKYVEVGVKITMAAVRQGAYWPQSINGSTEIKVPYDYKVDVKRAAKALAPITLKAKALKEKEDKLREETKSFLDSCGTVEMLVKRMPEFERHLPANLRSFPGAATANLFSNLTKAGFDATLKKKMAAIKK